MFVHIPFEAGLMEPAFLNIPVGMNLFARQGMESLFPSLNMKE
jgi:hypothetical protein